ncbi:MAG: LEA/WHy family protein [Planctomycetota bacterium]|jgi:LEA14-like dessication related protein
MSKRAMLTLVLVVLATLGSGGCQLGPRPTVDLVDARLASISLEEAALEFDLEVGNPYEVPLPLAGLEYRLRSRNAELVSGEAALDGTVPAAGSRVVTLPASVRFEDVLAAGATLRPGSVVPYEARIELVVEVPEVGTLRVPIEPEGQLPVPAAPVVSLGAFRLQKLALDETVAVLALRVTNANEFGGELKGLEYRLKIADTEIASARLDRSVSLEPGRTADLDIPISFAPGQLGLSLYWVLGGASAEYELSGLLETTTDFGPMSLPFERRGTVSLTR